MSISQLAATRGQQKYAVKPSADDGDLVHLVAQEGRIEWLGLVVGQEVQLLGRGQDPLPGGNSQALPPRRGREPRTEALGLLDPIKVLHKPQPCRLRHFCHVRIAKAAPPHST